MIISGYVKKVACLFSMVSVVWLHAALELSVRASGTKKIPLLLATVVPDAASGELLEVSEVVKKDFEFKNQFEVMIENLSSNHVTKSTISDFSRKGYPLVLFLNKESNDTISWRLYQTKSVTMMKGKKYHKQGELARGWGHGIADMVWPALTGSQGFFSTKIAYCKEYRKNNMRPIKHIYIADYDGSHAQPLVTTSSMSVAPRWNRDKSRPLLFYSECTPSNVRLMAIDMNKKKKIVSNFDGLNMLPTFSQDGKKVVYCASRGDGSCHLYYYDKDSFKKLTHNDGNNISPTLSDEGDKIFFCSDFKTGRPQLYCYDVQTAALEQLTEGGYCTSPTYCSSKNLLAYTKIVDGQNQIFVYDLTRKMHMQVTFDNSNKEECCWSPCGTMLLFGTREKDKSRLVILDVFSKQQRTVTAAQDICSYPAWSMMYQEFPAIA
ncbi:MAG: hypothetical protein M1114_04915 [Candidatus Dependentiae bacterium]|nr:hypothetical protein [Candidatus Dependentiae bacterium]